MELRLDASKAIALARARPEQTRRAISRFMPMAGAYTAGVMRRVIASRTKNAKGQTAASVDYAIRGDGVAVGPRPRATKWGVFDPVFLDQPTRPHDIRPRFAKALAFPRAGGRLGTRGGRRVSVFRFAGREVVSDLVYAAGVRHPGTRGIQFVQATVDTVADPLQRMLEAAMRGEAKGGA